MASVAEVGRSRDLLPVLAQRNRDGSAALSGCFKALDRPPARDSVELLVAVEPGRRGLGVNGNVRSLQMLVEETKHVWRTWLRRRSQRTRLTWERFKATVLPIFPLPTPRIRVQIWASP